MRTRTSIIKYLTLAVALGCGALSPQQAAAQAGTDSYTNTIVNGYNLIANHLDNGNNTLPAVLPVVPNDSALVKWDEAAQTFRVDSFDPAFGGWTDTLTGLPSTTTLGPREAAYLVNPGPTYQLVFTGQPRTPTPPPALTRNVLHYRSGQIKARARYEDLTGLAPAEGALVLRGDGVLHDFQTNRFTGGQWQPSEPVAEIGEGVVLRLPPLLLLDCSCLATQAVLYSGSCTGTIPDLCVLVSNCYTPSTIPDPGFSCNQFPAAGTPVITSTPIFLGITESNTFLQVSCTVIYNVGPGTNRFALLCPTNQVVACNATNWSFTGPLGWTNTCCTNVTITGPTIVTNWPLITAVWVGIDTCNGVIDVCDEIIFFGIPPTNCVCLDLICPPNLVIQTCLPPGPMPIGPALTNITYPLPVVSNYCIGTITNLVCTPPSGSPFPVGTNTVTCSVYDQLGNSATCSFDVIVLGDTTPPVIVCGPNQTVPCGTAWATNPPTATDACCPPSNIVIMQINVFTNNPGGCPEIISFVWDAMDCNGNHATCTNTVTLIDTTPPVIHCQSNNVLQCGSPLKPPTATDNCCPTPTVTMAGATTNVINGCTTLLTITWRATDCCTNTATCVEVVTITDTTPPVITCASNKPVECPAAWTFDPPTAMDACCGTNVTITILSTATNAGASLCLTVVTRTWRATDCCSNSATCSQVVTLVDTTPPVVTCASNKTIACGTPLTFDPPTAFDACCGTNVTITVLSTSPLFGKCIKSTTRAWLITDCCSNSVTCAQTVTIVDTIPPVITNCPASFTVNSGTPWSFGTPTAFDACCLRPFTIPGIIVVNTTTNVDGINCRVNYTRTWRAQDCCFNLSAPCSQTVTVNMLTAPPNDLCPNAIALTVNGGYLCGSNLCATPTPSSQFNQTPPTWMPCGASLPARDVWYKVVASCNGLMTVDTCQPCAGYPGFDTVVSAYTNNCSLLTQVSAGACNDDACGPSGLQSQITFPVLAGQTYLIRVAGANGLAAVGWFSIQATQTSPPPPNDQCTGAIALGLGTFCGTTLCATPSAAGSVPIPCGNSINAPDVWYSFTPQCSRQTVIYTCGNIIPNICGNTIMPFNTVLSVYTGATGLPAFNPPSCNALTPVTCNDDAPACSPQSLVSFFGTAGVTYYIRIAGNGAATAGDFQLTLVQSGSGSPPPNDLCANAIPVFAATYAWNNCDANTDGPTGTGCVPLQDVWFSYTPACAGTVSLSTCHSGIDTVLAVYSGPCGGLSLIACNDDAPLGVGPCGGNVQSYLTFAATAGTTYTIRVGSKTPVTGSGLLTINGPNPPAPTCPSAAVVPLCRYFRVMGPPNGTPWAWTITAPCCANVTAPSVPGVPAAGNNANTLAAAFVASINAACPPGSGLTAQAFPNLPLPGIFRVCVPCSTPIPWHLAVGPANTPPQNQCIVPNNTMVAPLPMTGGPCNFNPDIIGLPTTGQDANGNGIDDGVDIVLGTSADRNFNRIPDEVEDCFAPELTLNPESQVVQLGDNVLLTVAASGTAPFTYQWMHNGSPLSAGTASTLSITPVNDADLGVYTVAISNACGFALTAPVDITLVPVTQPVLYDLNFAAGWFYFTVDTKAGFDYVVEYKNDLNAGSWTRLTTVPGSGGSEVIYDREPLAQIRFYRVREQTRP